MTELEAFRAIYYKDATKYTQTVGKWSQAVLNLLDLAIATHEQPDKDGWVFIGDVVKEFNLINNKQTKIGELHWINLNCNYENENCFLWKTQTINY